jgi:phage terminase large subunit
VPKSRIVDRINAARSVIQRCRFARADCGVGLQMLRDWAFKYDDSRKTFSREPEHNYASHGGDAFSYGCQSVDEFASAPNPDDRYRDIGQPASHAFTLEQMYEDRDGAMNGRHF